MGLSGNSRGVGGGGGFKPENLPWEGYGYFMEQHIVLRDQKYLCSSLDGMLVHRT